MDIPIPMATADDPDMDGVIVYNHNGVILRRVTEPGGTASYDGSSFVSFVVSGTLNIRELRSDRWLEWIPEERDMCGEASTHEEWSLVDTIKRQTPPMNGDYLKKKIIYINLHEIKSLELRRSIQKLYMHLKNDVIYDVIFQHGDANSFITSFKDFAILEKSKRNRNKWYVHGCIQSGSGISKEITKSFAELDLFNEQKEHSSYVAKFMKDLHDRPFETTMTAFSKITGAVTLGINGYAFRNEDNDMDDISTADSIPRSINSGDEYEVIGDESILPFSPRPAVSRESPLSLEEWQKHINPDGSISEVDDLLQKIFKGGIEPAIRVDVWKYLLGYIPWNSNKQSNEHIINERISEYYNMRRQWQSITEKQEENFSLFRDRKNLIRKDVNRTDRTIEFYEGEENGNIEILNNILMTYMMYNFDLGYVQGMSDLLSPILILTNNESDAFWCFVGFMDKVMGNFAMEQTSMKEQLVQLGELLKTIDPQLAEYLNTHESGNLFFCFRWLLVLFKREFSTEDIMIIWEVLWTGKPCENFHLLLCLAILVTERVTIMSNNNGLSDILAHVNSLSMKLDPNNIIAMAEGIFLQLKLNSKNLPTSVCEILGFSPPITTSMETNGRTTPHTTSDDDEAYEQALSNNFL